MSRFGSYSRYGFLDYARMQHELGVELASAHVPESTGCCRACGRVFPCDGYEDGQYMQAHYLSHLPELAPTELVAADLAAIDLTETDTDRTATDLTTGDLTTGDLTATDLTATDLTTTDLTAIDFRTTRRAARPIRSAEPPSPHRAFVSAFNRMA